MSRCLRPCQQVASVEEYRGEAARGWRAESGASIDPAALARLQLARRRMDRLRVARPDSISQTGKCDRKSRGSETRMRSTDCMWGQPFVAAAALCRGASAHARNN